jgi:hypothetical protein
MSCTVRAPASAVACRAEGGAAPASARFRAAAPRAKVALPRGASLATQAGTTGARL